MSPDATSSSNEALQISLVGRGGGMGRDFCWSSGEEAHCTGIEANLTLTVRTSRVQGCGTWCKQVRPRVLALWYKRWSSVYAEEWWKEMVSSSSFVPGAGSLCLLLSGNHPRRSKYSPCCVSHVPLQIAACMLSVLGLFYCLLPRRSRYFRFYPSQP